MLPGQDGGIQEPPPINDWTAQVQAPAANPAWAQEQFGSVAIPPSTPSISAAARGVVDNGSLASASRGRRIHWGPVWSMDNGSDRCVTAQS